MQWLWTQMWKHNTCTSHLIVWRQVIVYFGQCQRKVRRHRSRVYLNIAGNIEYLNSVLDWVWHLTYDVVSTLSVAPDFVHTKVVHKLFLRLYQYLVLSVKSVGALLNICNVRFHFVLHNVYFFLLKLSFKCLNDFYTSSCDWIARYKIQYQGFFLYYKKSLSCRIRRNHTICQKTYKNVVW